MSRRTRRWGPGASIIFISAIIAMLAISSIGFAQEKGTKTSETEKGGAASESDETVVIPPAPVVTKRNPNSVAIPNSGGNAPKFESRPAVSPGRGAGGSPSETDGVPSAGLMGQASKLASRPAASVNLVPNAAIQAPVSKMAASNIQIGSQFGYRRDPFTGRSRFHSGLDIRAHSGQPVAASMAGTVSFVGWYHGYGNTVVVEHGGGVATQYCHLSGFAIEPGAQVKRGSIIGYAGSTGRATSPHLHYEVRLDGKAVNPLDAVALDQSSDFFKVQAAFSSGSPEAAGAKPGTRPKSDSAGEDPPAGATDRPRRVTTRPVKQIPSCLM